MKNPTYHYDLRFKFKGVRAHEKLTIAPGPNNPVGLVWIDLTKSSYGIHGTPRPEEIGKTQCMVASGLPIGTQWTLPSEFAKARR